MIIDYATTLGWPKQAPMNAHKIIKQKVGYRCTSCGVQWSSLTEADIKYLAGQGYCHGYEDKWFLCKYSQQHCLGIAGHEECVPLKQTLDWDQDTLKAYRVQREED